MVAKDRQKYGRFTGISFHAKESIGSDASSEDIVPSSTTQSFLILVPKWENVYHQEVDILPRPSTNGTVAISLPFCSEFLIVTVGVITTILGLFSLSSDQKPCKSFGEKPSVFLV